MQHATERVERAGESQEALDGKKDSLRVLKLFDHWLMGVPPSRPMRAKPYWNGIAAAGVCLWFLLSIGGFIRHHSGVQFWFSEKNHADFDILSIHLDPNMQRCIALKH